MVGRSAVRPIHERHQPDAEADRHDHRLGRRWDAGRRRPRAARCRSTRRRLAAVNGRPPDVILEMPTEYELPAEGQVPIFRVWDKNPFKEDVFIEALQIRPTNRR